MSRININTTADNLDSLATPQVLGWSASNKDYSIFKLILFGISDYSGIFSLASNTMSCSIVDILYVSIVMSMI